MPLKLAILASGNGSNAQAMFDAVERGALDAEIRLVLSNHPGARVLERAATQALPLLCLDHDLFPHREQYDQAMVAAIKDAGADCVALAGYMRLLTPAFLAAFPGRVLNIHPALLPSFKGLHGARDAFAWGVKLSGCTVHFVNSEMDCGPIIIQACVPLVQGESLDELEARIHVLEHRIYPQALQWLSEERLIVQGRLVGLAGREDDGKAPQPERAFVWPPLERGF